MSFDQIESDIMVALVAYTTVAAENKFSSDRDWTYFLKETLGKLGEEKKYKVCASGFKDIFDQEWLYDLVWYEEIGEGENRRLIDIPLVVESEWSPYFTNIKYDFEKLLIANVSHRLMICYVHKNNQQQTLDYFRQAIRLYKHCKEGERFMIAILDYETKKFIFDLIIR